MMITAQEARELTFDNIKNGQTKELEMISKLIDDAIKDGKYEINGDGSLYCKIIERFKELGYNAKNEFVKNESYWNISWK